MVAETLATWLPSTVKATVRTPVGHRKSGLSAMIEVEKTAGFNK